MKTVDPSYLARHVRSVLLDGGAPERAVDLVLAGDLLDTEALRYSRDAHAKGTGLVLLAGAPGCGKTTAAVAWLREYVPADPFRVVHHAPLFLTSSALGRWPRFDWGAMKSLEAAPAIVLDDFGREFSDKAGAFASLLDELVDLRYAGRQPLLLTTNVTAAQALERAGERVRDRWREAGLAFETRETSLRGRAA